jgi:tetratricopeptide (TPR) repeat protein
MAHRIYRLSLSPEDVPGVRRVVDFDGRCTLADVHAQIADFYKLDDSDHMYAFFTSGRYWDKESAYFDPRTEGRRTDRALLFRLNLTPGKSLAYLLDFGMEQRFTVTVVAISDVEEPLSQPVLVESVGDVLDEHDEDEGDDDADGDESADPPELAPLVALAEAFLDAHDQLDELEGEPEDAPDRSGPILVESADLALPLLSALAQDSALFFRLDDWLLERSLSVRLLELPMELSHVGESERGIALARALVFVDRELMLGDLAILLAKAGRREEALAQVAQSLDTAEDAALVEAKAGETYRALGDLPAAEAYFRRSLVEAKTPNERMQALIRIAGCLIDQGRNAEANEIMQQTRKLDGELDAQANPPAVGRNEPCPCGSGKKYKKCHGAAA